MPILDIIIVNWNAGEQLRQTLAAVAASRHASFELGRVVVVDNASIDGSLEGLDRFHLPLVLLRNGDNRGFAAACNQGAAASKADYLLFLNPDTRVSPDALDRSVDFMERAESDRVGLLGVQLVGDERSISRTCVRFPKLRHLLITTIGLDRVAPRRFPGLVMAEWDHASARDVDHVMGAYFFTRRSVFEALEGFDEGFFVYIEDIDYALRVHQAGFRTHYLADVQIYHKGCGTSEHVRARRLSYALYSRLYYGYKHFSFPAATVHLACTLSIEFAARMVQAALRRSGRDLIETLSGYALLCRRLPVLFSRPRPGPSRTFASLVVSRRS